MKYSIPSLLAVAILLFSEIAFCKGMSVNDPYVRAIPPGQKISAAFMLLKNNSDKDIDLIKASSDSAKHVELHEHVHEDGMMKMRQVAKISVAAHGQTVLKPGGYHIMLIGLVKPIQPKDMINITLEFSDGSKQQIKAEVKKIIMGMMKKKMSMMNKGMQLKQHANPMPNLMAVFKKMAGELNLTDKQQSQLKAGIEARSPKIKALYAKVKELEDAIYKATLKDESLTKIDQLADKLIQARLDIIQGKIACRESVKEILDDKQFQKMVSLYRTKIMPKTKKLEENSNKMVLMKHTNPLPNLMQIILKMGDQLSLSQQQLADLEKWHNERSPITSKLAKTIVSLEINLMEAALNNESTMKLDQLADAIMQNRVKMIRGKALCRDNMKRILNNEQYAKVIELYKNKSL